MAIRSPVSNSASFFYLIRPTGGAVFFTWLIRRRVRKLPWKETADYTWRCFRLVKMLRYLFQKTTSRCITECVGISFLWRRIGHTCPKAFLCGQHLQQSEKSQVSRNFTPPSSFSYVPSYALIFFYRLFFKSPNGVIISYCMMDVVIGSTRNPSAGSP